MAKQFDIYSPEGQQEFKDNLPVDIRPIYDSLVASGLRVRGYWAGRELRIDLSDSTGQSIAVSLTMDMENPTRSRNWYVYQPLNK